MKLRIVIAGLVLASFVLVTSCMTVPVAATSNPVGSKVGEAVCVAPLNIPFGGGGIQSAAKNGGISKVSTVDLKVQQYIIFAIYTTIVTGE